LKKGEGIKNGKGGETLKWGGEKKKTASAAIEFPFERGEEGRDLRGAIEDGFSCRAREEKKTRKIANQFQR